VSKRKKTTLRPSEKIFLRRVARRIFELRRAAGLTQAELAERIDVSVPYQARVEGGQNLTLLTLRKYAEVFHVEPEDMLKAPASIAVKVGRPTKKPVSR
jgi:XRE family aerobic/anaerobic benzoate catabolism transcriptional regulator